MRSDSSEGIKTFSPPDSGDLFGLRGRPSRAELIPLIIILILAAVLRMGWPGLTEFKADEARLLTLALDVAEGQQFHVRGISSSVGIPNFPMSVWLYALPLVVWKQVYSATLFTGLLNTLAVLGCWWFVRRYWGAGAALAATLMYAVSPWAVIFSRKIWAQNLLPLLVMIWAISAVLTFIERRHRFIIIHLLSLVVAVQTHLSAVALVAATALFLLLFRRRVNWRWTTVGVGLAILTVLPFIHYLLSNEATLDSGLELTTGLEATSDLKSFRLSWLISLGRDLHSLAGAEAFQDYLESVPDLSLAHWLWAALILGGIGWLAWQTWRDKECQTSQVGLIVLIWVLVPPLFFARHSTPVFSHYFFSTYPAQYIAAGALFGFLVKRLRTAGWAVLTLSAIAQMWNWGTLLAFVSTVATPGGFGTPLAIQLQATQLAQAMLSEESATEVLIAGPGESPGVDQFAAVNSVLLRSVPHRFVNVNQSAVFPETAAIVLMSHRLGELSEQYAEAARQIEHVPRRAGEESLWVLAVPGQAAPLPDHALPSPTLANGVALLGYDLSHPDDDLASWQIFWRSGPPSSADYHFFNHLIDSSGQRVSQADGAAFSASQWHPGDVVISRFSLPWPTDIGESLTVRVGMYTFPEIENVPVLDIAGLPLSDAVEIAIP
jgi:4-amino-4-deoxy-L-arabinose transferase-like glycosyltransferase